MALEHDTFEQQLKQQLNRSLDHVDDAARDALRQRRQLALADSQQFHRWAWFGSLTSSAAVVAAVVWGIFIQPTGQLSIPLNDPIAFTIATDETDIELYQDLEFIEWLDVVEDNG